MPHTLFRAFPSPFVQLLTEVKHSFSCRLSQNDLRFRFEFSEDRSSLRDLSRSRSTCHHLNRFQRISTRRSARLEVLLSTKTRWHIDSTRLSERNLDMCLDGVERSIAFRTACSQRNLKHRRSTDPDRYSLIRFTSATSSIPLSDGVCIRSVSDTVDRRFLGTIFSWGFNDTAVFFLRVDLTDGGDFFGASVAAANSSRAFLNSAASRC